MPTGQPVRVVDPETGGCKESKLARHDLVPPAAITELAEHFGRGAEKYEDRNWEKGYNWSLSYAALQRHLHAFWGGQDLDPETGSKHIVAAMWHCVVLSTFMDTHAEKDDRPTRVEKPPPWTLRPGDPTLCSERTPGRQFSVNGY